ncbi:MAG: ATP-dependent protease LonB [Thermoplasmata archaeon]|nr:ATP-dependent protease LonB [Thermoplasmata archaeon]MCI4359944.1 ATP-dependent protease LonB [Thermoplasmata archaeon]
MDASAELDAWSKNLPYETTAQVDVPPRLLDQVIGQDEAVEVAKKAATQKRHMLLIGEPGTGKSMLARAMVDFLPKEQLQDILAYPNVDDPNEPKIRVVPAGKGKEIVSAQKLEVAQRKEQRMILVILASLVIFGFALYIVLSTPGRDPTAILVALLIVLVLYIFVRLSGGRSDSGNGVAKLLVSHTPDDRPPFIDATGAHAGALLGDVKHDPFQSGGLETPPHERVEVGAIHKANGGVLFVDEINLLKIESQHSLLTTLQERKFPIVGQSERSAGAMVKTEPVPADFVLVAAGNVDSVQAMHPALRSRVRGYGYEVYVKTTMPDVPENRMKIVRFVAQEVAKDKKIAHFDMGAVGEILREAQRRAGHSGQLTLRLRELGGLVRVAGDIANTDAARVVTAEHVVRAKRSSRSLEQQIADRYIERRKEYRMFKVEGAAVGIVNGLAAINAQSGMSEFSGIVLPIVAEVTPAQTRDGGVVVATGKLGEIAREAVQNVTALIKKYTGEDISRYDIHIQFVGTSDGVEGDSASVSIATAVISALEGVAVDQSVAMTGSLSVRGQVLPVGGVTAKVEAAADSGLKRVLIPEDNLADLVLETRYRNLVEVIPVRTLRDVLKYALVGQGRDKETLLERLAAMVHATSRIEPAGGIAKPPAQPAGS